MQIPSAILEQYTLSKIENVDAVSIGLIHRTYKIETSDGDFILQKLHEVLASDGVGEDFAAVLEHLEHADFPAPRLVRTKDGEVLAKADDEVWRMQTALEGGTREQMSTADEARAAGAFLGRFHAHMQSLDHEFQSDKPLHMTRDIFRKFEELMADADISDIKDEVELIQAELPKLFLPNDLPKHVIHGDPKMSNFLWKDGNAYALIDLDTCARHTPLVELGDAFRSWCGGREDDPANSFNKDFFDAGLAGYLETTGDFLSAREQALIPMAAATISLELAMRFLNDYIEDNYFGWDDSRYESRKAHNLARARGQIALFKSMREQEVV
jgi:Ser/Thr protein kinase RdoA (MazF antagonist)